MKSFLNERRHSSLLKLIIQGFRHLTLESRPAVLCIRNEPNFYDMRRISHLVKMNLCHLQTMLCCIKVCNGLMTHLITFFTAKAHDCCSGIFMSVCAMAWICKLCFEMCLHCVSFCFSLHVVGVCRSVIWACVHSSICGWLCGGVWLYWNMEKKSLSLTHTNHYRPTIYIDVQ